MKPIKLTTHSNVADYDGKPIIVGTFSHIFGNDAGGSTITFAPGDILPVKETPEQIWAMIQEEEAVEDKPRINLGTYAIKE